MKQQSVSPIWVTYHEDGKLEGMQSISTPSYLNSLCIARQKCADKVCAKCYAMRDVKRKKTLREHLENNFKILTRRLLTPDECRAIPITTLYARIESFGDVQNVTQALNYLRIIWSHPLTKFGVWTKNKHIWDEAITRSHLPVPLNMTFVLSSEKINEPTAQKSDYVDHIFTVYDKQHAQATEINCGGTKCSECGYKCYRKEEPFYINELLR